MANSKLLKYDVITVTVLTVTALLYFRTPDEPSSETIRLCRRNMFWTLRSLMEICYCDKFCLEVGDCCVDYELQCRGLKINSIVDYGRIILARNARNSLYECQRSDQILNSGIGGYKVAVKALYMISWCPESVSIDKITCEENSNFVTRTPVSISDDLVFKNIYCAYCDGYRNNLIVWNASYICPDGSYNSDILTRMDLVTLDSESVYVLNNRKLAHGHACNNGVVKQCRRDYPANANDKPWKSAATFNINMNTAHYVMVKCQNIAAYH